MCPNTAGSHAPLIVITLPVSYTEPDTKLLEMYYSNSPISEHRGPMLCFGGAIYIGTRADSVSFVTKLSFIEWGSIIPLHNPQ